MMFYFGNIIAGAIDGLIYFWFFYKLFGTKYSAKKTCICTVIIMAIIRLATLPIWGSPFKTIGLIIVIMIYVITLFKEQTVKKIVVVFIFFALSLICDVIALFIYIKLGHQINVQTNAHENINLFGFILEYSFCLIIMYAFIKTYKKLSKTNEAVNTPIKNKQKYYIIVYSILQLAVTITVYTIYIRSNLTSIAFPIVCISMIVVSGLLGIFLTKSLVAITKEKNKQEFMEREIHARDRQYKQMQLQHDQFRKFKHDFYNHINTLKRLQELNEKEEMNRYVDSMKSELDTIYVTSFCTNPTIDALLFVFKSEMENEKIDSDIIFVLPENKSIEIYDLCTIVSNLLKNAIEAAKEFDGKKYVKIRTKNRAGNFVILVKNSSNPPLKNLDTTKKDKENHGMGIDIVNAIIHKYGSGLSNFVYEYKDNEFTAIVSIAE